MATNPRKRQKKLEKRSAKRKEKKHHLVRDQNAGLAERLSGAARFPILHCWIGDSLEDTGIGWVLLSREFPDGRVAVASFLVDRYCLGVKNVVAEILGRFAYDDKYVRKMQTEMPSRDATPAEARKLLEQAVAYARGLGLHPHPDYAKMMALFGSVNAADSDATFEFGQDGMPFFVAGPHDTPARCRQILATLTDTCGEGNFHYLLPLMDSTVVPMGELPFLDADEDDEFIDDGEEGEEAEV